MGLTVKIWGARGSLPTPHAPQDIEEKLAHVLRMYEEARKMSDVNIRDFIASLEPAYVGGYSGHTSCVEVTSPSDAQVIVDGGSGIRKLGDKLMRGPCGVGRGEVHIFMTHFHWDHLIGLPFFVPIFVKGNKIHFYAVQDDLEENIIRKFSKPNFPVPFESLGADVLFHKLDPRKPFQFQDITLTPYQLDHPDPCWGYKFENGGKIFSHCVDSECTRISREDLGPDLPLYQNADLITFDAQYTFLEATDRINWGHSSAPIGLDLARREKVKKVIFVHFDPASSDIQIQKAEKQTREYYESQKKQLLASAEGQASGNLDAFFEVEWLFAREGMEINL